MILLFISFLAGVLTVLAPCTITLLPVIVGGSLSGGHSRARAFVITLSLGVSVFLFTIILKVSTLLINIPQSFWQFFSGTLILILGFIMLFPSLWERLPLVGRLNVGSNKILGAGYLRENIIGDIVIGAALGPVFSTCSPTYFLILATVLPKSLGVGFIYLLAYIAGLCGFLFLVSLLSGKVVEKLGVVSESRGWFKRTIGIIFIILGLAIILGLDQKLELSLSSTLFDVTKIEQRLLNPENPTSPVGSSNAAEPSPDQGSTTDTKPLSQAERIKIKSKKYDLAPEIANPSGFVNTNGAPITITGLRGKKVVLVDFWTYSCINCQRTIPYLNAWYQKYKDEGLEIVSIHTPEFSFEKVLSNVEDAVKRFDIKYPVVLDNDYGTWNAFGNQYWPRDYLIDIDGFIVHDHAGEGDYDITEKAIQQALAERADILGNAKVSTGIVAPKDAVEVNPSQVGSPETYFGSNRNQYLANGRTGVTGTQTLSIPPDISLNRLYLSGKWNFSSEFAESSDPSAKIVYKYNTKNVYFVASSEQGVNLKIILDGKSIDTVLVKENRLYQIISGTEYGQHTLEIDVQNGTLDAYTFTFG